MGEVNFDIARLLTGYGSLPIFLNVLMSGNFESSDHDDANHTSFFCGKALIHLGHGWNCSRRRVKSEAIVTAGSAGRRVLWDGFTLCNHDKSAITYRVWVAREIIKTMSTVNYLDVTLIPSSRSEIVSLGGKQGRSVASKSVSHVLQKKMAVVQRKEVHIYTPGHECLLNCLRTGRPRGGEDHSNQPPQFR
ncbi:hypothetical protein J6590_024542 [Homalodisca vitripennis]|nr:hypothetical protein J6590_024542 [Homalodisca vitripennis]